MALRILAILTSIVILVYGIGAYFVFPEFEELYSGFGARIPFFTKAVLITYPYWLVFLVVPIGIYAKYLTRKELAKKTQNKILAVFISILLFSVALFPLLITAMYLPIFEMGNASG